MKIGPVGAGRLASSTSMVRPEIYRVLRELAAKGLVRRTPGAPSIYDATAPDRALSIIIDRYKTKLHEMESKKTDLIKIFGAYPQREANALDAGFSAIRGVDNVDTTCKEMILRARKEYSAIMSKHGLKRANVNGVKQAILSASRRHVRVRILSEIDETNSSVAKVLAKHVSLKQSNQILFYVDIIDGKEVLFGPAHGDADVQHPPVREIDLFTNNSQFVTGICALFEHLWRTSALYKM